MAQLPEGVTMDKLLSLYEQRKRMMEKRAAFFQTEEGKLYNRSKAKLYYKANKEKVLAKMAERRADKREEQNDKALDYYYNNREAILARGKERRAEKAAAKRAVEAAAVAERAVMTFSPPPAPPTPSQPLQPSSYHE
jgi:hypothetical protein